MNFNNMGMDTGFGSMSGNEIYMNTDNPPQLATQTCFKPTQFTSIANHGTFSNNPLASLFFSDTNVNALHEAIRFSVWKKTEKVIGRQADNELFAIMNSMFKQFGRHGVDVLGETKRLNGLVLDYAIPDILKEMKMDEKYLNEVGRNPVPLARSTNVNSKGTKLIDVTSALG